MSATLFSIKDAFDFGQAMVKEKFRFLLTLFFISGFFSVLPDITALYIHDTRTLFFIQAACFVIGLVIDVGLVFVMLRLHDGKGVRVSDIFSQYPVTFVYAVATAVYVLMTVGVLLAGIVLLQDQLNTNLKLGIAAFVLSIPGVYLALRYQFYSYYLVDKRVGIVESFRESARITDGHKWHLLRFALSVVGINILGVLAFGVGLFVTIPISMLATVYVYRKLSSPVADTTETIEESTKNILTSLENTIIAPEEV